MRSRITLLLAFLCLLSFSKADAQIAPQPPIGSFSYEGGNQITGLATAGVRITAGQLLVPNSTGQLVLVDKTATHGVVAISTGEAQQYGYSVRVALFGVIPVRTDNACTIGYSVTISSTVDGTGHCVSAWPPDSQLIGVAAETTSRAGPVLTYVGLTGAAGQPGETGAVGPTGPAGQGIGAWITGTTCSPSTTPGCYANGAVVSYMDNLYSSNADNNQGHLPTDTMYWTIIDATFSGGTVVNPTTFESNVTMDSNTHMKGPVPWVDASVFGVRPIPTPISTITVTTFAANHSLDTTGVADFQVLDGIVIPKAGADTSQATPSAPGVYAINASGSASISYKCAPIDAKWGIGIASPAGTTSTASNVFGVPAVGITSVVRASNVVTVTTSSPMFASSGTYHARIGNVTGDTVFSGLYPVTITSSTTLTYAQTAANGSGTVAASSFVRFVNDVNITQVQATAGSNQLVITTDVNHNFQSGNVNFRPQVVFLDGIDFAAANPRGYANGVFPIDSVTANTFTITTQYTSPITVTATVAALGIPTSGVAQMTASTWAVVDVNCPVITGTTKYYAVYADYGSGYSPIGFTHWMGNADANLVNGPSIFEDYGPGLQKAGFTPPPAMNLPSTPPVAAQKQVFVGQVQSVVGSVINLTGNVPAAVTGVTAYHDNGIALQNALDLAGINFQAVSPVYIPPYPTAGSPGAVVLFSAPVDVSATNAAPVIRQGAQIRADGTIYADSAVYFDWKRADSTAGITNFANSVGSTVGIEGYAHPLMSSGKGGFFQSLVAIDGISFQTQAASQDGLVFSAANSTVSNSSFITNCTYCVTSMPWVIQDSDFNTHVFNLHWSGPKNFQYPIPEGGQNNELGQVTWWPVPVVEMLGPFFSSIQLDGQSYGTYRGWRLNTMQDMNSTLLRFVFENVSTFQDPWQPFFTYYGDRGAPVGNVEAHSVVMDSNNMPIFGCVRICATYMDASQLATKDGETPELTGSPNTFAHEVLTHGASPMQNTNEVYQDSTGVHSSAVPSFTIAPLAQGAVPTVSGTGACGTTSTQVGGSWAGKATCTGTTGASTLVITPGTTATNGWQCDASDLTTANALRQSASSTTTCTISGTVNANDVLIFKAVSF